MVTRHLEFDEVSGALLRTVTFEYGTTGSASKRTKVESGKTTIVKYGYNNTDQLSQVDITENGVLAKTLMYEYDQDGNRLAKTTLVNGTQSLPP